MTLQHGSRRAFTLVELLVALAIISLVIAMVLPAVLAARAAARRTQCQSNLRQIGLAAHQYAEVHGALPPFDPGGVLYFLLPFVESNAAHQAAKKAISQGGIEAGYDAVGTIPMYHCPDDTLSHDIPNSASYVINRGTPLEGAEHRAFHGPNGLVRWADVTDGLSNTVLASEWVETKWHPMNLEDYHGPRGSGQWLTWTPGPCEITAAWIGERCLADINSRPADWGSHAGRVFSIGIEGYNHILPPNSGSCIYVGNPCYIDAQSAVSRHPGGVHALVADGSVRFVSENISAVVWRHAGSISDGTVPAW